MNKEEKVLSSFDLDQQGNWFSRFFEFNIEEFQKLLVTKDEQFWKEKGKARALNIFHAGAERIPAYKDFLKKHGIGHARVKTIKDFEKVPVSNKKNYVQMYPIKDLCWDGDITKSSLVAMSSGTSGTPTFWPRGAYQEFEAAVTHELLYRSFFEIDTYPTLLVIGFPMGVYVSGIATLLPSELVAVKGYDMTVVAVGNNKSDMLRVVKLLKENYRQVLLVGHPLFIKDVIETGKEENIDWSQRRLRMMFCSEGFSEEWRNYVVKTADIPFHKSNVISTYGSSEMLLVAYETPLCLLIREIAEKSKTFHKTFFGDRTLPYLFQYNPLMRYIESVHNELIMTSASGVPLIRYNIQDRGNVIDFDEVFQGLEREDSAKELTKIPLWRLPFLALRGRSDDAVVFYAANIYKEHIQRALEHASFLKTFTGKFLMQKGYLKNMDEFLEINIELQRGVQTRSDLEIQVKDHIVRTLRELNAEYLDASSHLSKDMIPHIKLWQYQDEKYFKPGVKPRYIVKS